MSENNYGAISTEFVNTTSTYMATWLINPMPNTPPEPEPFIHERNTTPWTPPIVDRTKNKRHLDAEEEEI